MDAATVRNWQIPDHAYYRQGTTVQQVLKNISVDNPNRPASLHSEVAGGIDYFEQQF